MDNRLLELSDKLKRLRLVKSDLEAQTKGVNEEIDGVMTEMIEIMTTEELTSFNRNGTTFSLVTTEYKTITECVESLPEEYSTIIQLHYMSKISLRELAKRMYMSRVAVTKRRDDALDMIANCLSGL